MRPRNGAHRVRRRRIIEQNAAAAIDLQIDEAGRQHRSRRHDFGRPVTHTLTARRDILNHPTIDQDDGIVVPSNSIENTVCRNCEPGCFGVFGWFWADCFACSLAKLQTRSIR
jgi:hypothetical protein